MCKNALNIIINILNCGGYLMKYRSDKYGNQISVLGYGCMRFSHKGGKIDFEKAEKEILRAYELGIN